MAKPTLRLKEEYYRQLDAGRVYDVALRPGHAEMAAATRSGEIFVVATDSGEVVRKLKGHRESVLSVAWTADGQFLISGGKDHTIRLWDGDSGEFTSDLNGIVGGPERKTLRGQMFIESRPGHLAPVTAITTAADGVMATGSVDTRVKVWRDNEVRRTFDWHTAEVTALAFHPSQPEILLSAARDGMLRTWNIATGALRDRYQWGGDEIEAAGWIDDDRIASADLSGEVHIWERGRSRPRRTVTAPAAVRALTTLGSRVVLVGLQSGDLVAYDSRAPRRMKDPSIGTYEAHDFAVRTLDLDESGNRMASGGDDGVVSIWTVALS